MHGRAYIPPADTKAGASIITALGGTLTGEHASTTTAPTNQTAFAIALAEANTQSSSEGGKD